MRCSLCEADNRAGVAYCEACGATLAEVCRRCAAALTPGARFCGACGEPARARDAGAAATPAPEGERKQVSVLFCDMVGSTALAQLIGAEAMHGVLDRFFRLAVAELERFGVGIHKYLGDGFMTVLGLPQAIEDHAERAVLAALAVRDRIERDLGVDAADGVQRIRVRIGIDSGTVVVAPLGGDRSSDYTTIGDTANVAARLQALAEPGQILVAEETTRLLGRAIRTAPLGVRSLKGRRSPLQVHRVLGVAPPRGALTGLDDRRLTRFVGRERPLAALVDLLDQAVGGEGQAVAIVGEPGIGKSRMLHELRRRAASRRLTVLEGRCLPYAVSLPYGPLLDILRANAGIRRREDPVRVREKLAAALEEVGMEEAWLPYLAALLSDGEGIPDGLTPEATKARTFDALRLLCLQGSRRRPLVLVVEDLHWIDRTSEEFLRALAEDLEAAPLLLLTTHRPGYRPPWLELSCATQLALRSLAPDAAAEVVRSAIGAGAMPAQVASAILDRAEGNPLFLEELARAAGEEPDAQAPVPATIHGVIAARIDRLDPQPRRVLQTAAVLGREFPPLLLELLWGGEEDLAPALADLKRAGFLHERAGNPSMYVFKHGLTHDVAEASLLQARREELHRAAGQALESLYAGREHQVEDRLAYHYSRCGEPRLAVVHLERLAEASAGRYAHEEASAALREAIAHAEGLPPAERARARFDLTLRLVNSLYFLGELEESRRLLAGLGEVVDELGDPRLEALFHFWLAHTLSHLADPDGARVSADRALRLSAESEDRAVEGLARYALSREAWWGGRFPEGVEQGRAAAVELERTGQRWWLVHCQCYIGHSLLYLGEIDDALAVAGRALALGEEAGDPRLQSFAAWTRGMYLATRGDGEAAVGDCQRALALSPDPANTAWALGILAFATAQSGRYPRAVELFERSLAQVRAARHPRVECWFGGWLAEAHLLGGARARARTVAQEALRLAESLRVPWAVARALRVLGGVALAEGETAGARRTLEAAHRLQETMTAPVESALTALDLADCCRQAGDPDEAAAWVGRALTALAGRPVEPHRARAARIAGELGPRDSTTPRATGVG